MLSLVFPLLCMASISYNDLLALLTDRRSIRYFSDRSVDDVSIKNILETGRLAPSVENIQPWHFHVIKNEKLKEEMMGTSCYGNFVAGSSVFIVITSDRSKASAAPATLWNPRELEYSCAVAVHSMMLAAVTLGLGSCWVSLHHGPAHDALKLKDHQAIVGGLMLGYAKTGEEHASKEHQRVSIDTMVTTYAE